MSALTRFFAVLSFAACLVGRSSSALTDTNGHSSGGAEAADAANPSTAMSTTVVANGSTLKKKAATSAQIDIDSLSASPSPAPAAKPGSRPLKAGDSVWAKYAVSRALDRGPNAHAPHLLALLDCFTYSGHTFAAP